MKKMKQTLTLLLAVLLFVSILAVNISAATIVGKTCTATVTQTKDYAEVLDIGQSHIYHVAGSTSGVNYVSPDFKSNVFDASIFPAGYRSDLLSAYSAAGYKTQVTLPARKGSVIVNASWPTGTYTAVRYYVYGDGKWQAETDLSTTSGTFKKAPIRVEILAYLWS